MNSSDFERLMRACADLASRYPDGLVFIGGIAVYLHAVNTPQAADLAEFTHDADLYLSLADMGDLRDAQTLTPNRRLSKHQLILDGFEFDVYTERLSSLPVPYDAVMAHAVGHGELRCACPEHLVVMKIEAYRDRRASTKGAKDAKDLARIALVAREQGRFDGSLVAPYLSDEHMRLLAEIERGPQMVALARGNAVVAKRLRAAFAAMRDAVERSGRDG